MTFRDDWVRWGWGDDLGPPGSGEFTIDYRAAYPHDKLTIPALVAAEVCRDIRASFPGPLTVMVSGGVDSQAAAFAFKASGVPVRYVMARYNGDLNAHDLKTLDTFYERYRITPEFLEVDILAFHEHELWDWARRFDCASPHLLSHMKIASLIPNGTVVFSGTVVSRDGRIGQLSWDTFALERYARISGQSVIPYFFTYDPRLHHSFGRLPAAYDLSDPDDYGRKCRLYRQGGFPVVPQERKLHGFEVIKELYDSTPVPARTKLKFASLNSKRPYDLLYRFPLQDELRKIPHHGAKVVY